MAMSEEHTPVLQARIDNVSGRLLVAQPSVVLAVPVRVTVALSLSVTFTGPLPVALTASWLHGPVHSFPTRRSSDLNWSSAAVTVIEVVAPLVAPLANAAVLAV